MKTEEAPKTDQEIFDYVVGHLRKQNAKALTPNQKACVYRNEEGLTCAAGCLIPEGLYHDGFEGSSFRTVLNGVFHRTLIGEALSTAKERAEQLRALYKVHNDLIEDLQGLHDKRPVENWEPSFARVAANHELKYTAPVEAA